MHICGPRLQRLSNFVNAGFATQTAQSRYSSAPELQSPMIEQLAVRASGLAVQRTITITYGFAVWTQLPNRRRDTEFQEMRTDHIDLLRARRNQAIARFVQHQQTLLLNRLGTDFFDVAARNRFADGSRIGRIVFGQRLA